ncbi:23S rRNA (pseudouridine(1915)-N(3))-methyltransferase RlmH [Lachnospiraceae bacterium JLR.KK008]
MKITVIGVGKIKEAYFRDAIGEYTKRLSRYCKLELCEVADDKTPDGASVVMQDAILEREAGRILGRIPEGSYVIVLDIGGKKMDSVVFARKIEQLGTAGKSHLTFVIGGSLGLHSTVKEKAALSVSFSDMTFPHQLMRVILLEQIYRGYRIISGEPYHK